MNAYDVQDLRGGEAEFEIDYVPEDETVVIRLNKYVSKISIEQYIAFNKKNDEFLKNLAFEIPAIRR